MATRLEEEQAGTVIVVDRNHGEQATLPITVIVSPVAGRLRILPPRRFVEGREYVEAGQPVLVIEQGDRSDEVISPVRGRFGGVLGREGEPVTPGQPVAWVEQE
jgi:biotin carboxyl carrier protein